MATELCSEAIKRSCGRLLEISIEQFTARLMLLAIGGPSLSTTG